MAEMNTNAGHTRHKAGVRRSKKNSTKVDLTLMVDLGFLLITFFIFTTSMTTPKAMKLYLPAGEIPGTAYAQTTVLTIIPISAHQVFYYHGDLAAALQNDLYGVTGFSMNNGIGDVIRNKQMTLEKSTRFKRGDMTLIIKPAIDASYKDIIAALDEVLINDLKHYSFEDLETFEKETLKQYAP